MSVEVSEARYLEITKHLWQASWFHGLLPREEAERRLRADGQFLVRQSPSIARQFVLSGMNSGEIRHMCLIGRGPSGRVGLQTSYKQLKAPICRSAQSKEISEAS
jgi:hypothetical protein